jgi:hypothetical protein
MRSADWNRDIYEGRLAVRAGGVLNGAAAAATPGTARAQSASLSLSEHSRLNRRRIISLSAGTASVM